MDSHEDKHTEAARQATQRAADAARKAREYANGLVAQQKLRAATGLAQFGSTIRDTASRLNDDRDSTLAGYAEAVAEKLDTAAKYVEHRDPATMLSDAQQFARRRPELVIGGMFVAGVALARFLKASGPSEVSTSAAAPDVYVPLSKRTEPATATAVTSTSETGPLRYSAPAAATFSSPRGVSSASAGATSLPRPTEAAGGDMLDSKGWSTPTTDNGPNANPEEL